MRKLVYWVIDWALEKLRPDVIVAMQPEPSAKGRGYTLWYEATPRVRDLFYMEAKTPDMLGDDAWDGIFVEGQSGMHFCWPSIEDKGHREVNETTKLLVQVCGPSLGGTRKG